MLILLSCKHLLVAIRSFALTAIGFLGYPLLQTAEPSLGQVVDLRSMVELPNPSGNSSEFQLLAPGTANSGGIAIHQAAFNNGTSQITVNGNTPASNEYAIDGIPNTIPSATRQPDRSAAFRQLVHDKSNNRLLLQYGCRV